MDQDEWEEICVYCGKAKGEHFGLLQILIQLVIVVILLAVGLKGVGSSKMREDLGEGKPFTIVTDEGTDRQSEHTIEKPTLLTVICHQEGIQVDIRDIDVMEIGPEQTVAFSNELPNEHWLFILGQPEFMRLWNIVFPQLPVPPILIKGSLAQKHIVGLIMLTLQAMGSGKRPFLRLPESYCHPTTQRYLVNLIHALQGKSSEDKQYAVTEGNQ